MSKNVEQRVVDMQFRNEQFEAGVKQSINSLDRLSKSLDVEKASKSLEDFGNIGSKMHLGGIADSLEEISSKFNALGIIGVTTLVNLTNKAGGSRFDHGKIAKYRPGNSRLDKV